jgi:hypothetical protein
LKELNMLKITTIALTATSLFLQSGCGESSSSSEAQASPSEHIAQTTEQAWVLTNAPSGDISVIEAKTNAKEGDQIVIRGRIGGRTAPLSADSPVFTVVDLSLPYCGQNTDENCPAPWDYCCTSPDTIASSTATVKVDGDSIDFVAGGLAPLDEIIITGAVGPRPDEKVLTIMATGIYSVGG